MVNFLGNVNIFPAGAGGKALLGPLALEYPEHPHLEARDAAGGTLDPTELDISRSDDGEVWAVVTGLSHAGRRGEIEVVDPNDSGSRRRSDVKATRSWGWPWAKRCTCAREGCGCS